jgi:hypothetical protein
MIEVKNHGGGNGYNVPHVKKEASEQQVYANVCVFVCTEDCTGVFVCLYRDTQIHCLNVDNISSYKFHRVK